MKSTIIKEIEIAMLNVLDNAQLEKLRYTLTRILASYEMVPSLATQEDAPDLIALFIAAKRVEGCSSKTLKYYEVTLSKTLTAIGKPVKHISTDDLRAYLDMYYRQGRISRITIDNVRRILSSFFSWLEDENHIMKSPVRRIHKIKVTKTVKETYSDEMLETMRDHARCSRDLAMIDLLASTGMRVGELVKLNRSDIDFVNRECIVFGKGNKERKVYFDARTKLHLSHYLNSRQDENPALFVSLTSSANRLQISGVEIRLRQLGRRLNFIKVHPHKFRRTLATMAIDKGMPIEQVQQLLGHQSVDTTLQYAMVNQNNVKLSHHKFLS